MSTKPKDISEQLRRLQEKFTEGLVIDDSEVEIVLSPRRLKSYSNRTTLNSSEIENLKMQGAVDAAAKYEAKKP